MKNISSHITYDEATKSPTAIRHGIENTPTPQRLENMEAVANACFEPLRLWYNRPIKINSFYRCTLLNDLVKGSKTSEHVVGKAIDLDAGSKEENKIIFDWCKANLKYNQLINEYDYSWVHISFDKGNNRNQTLVIK